MNKLTEQNLDMEQAFEPSISQQKKTSKEITNAITTGNELLGKGFPEASDFSAKSIREGIESLIE